MENEKVARARIVLKSLGNLRGVFHYFMPALVPNQATALAVFFGWQRFSTHQRITVHSSPVSRSWLPGSSDESFEPKRK
jgi:hypothetical protein